METHSFRNRRDGACAAQGVRPPSGRPWRHARAMEGAVQAHSQARAFARSSWPTCSTSSRSPCAGSSTGSRKPGWSSGRRDPDDRRAWRLNVTAKAQPLDRKAPGGRRRACRSGVCRDRSEGHRNCEEGARAGARKRRPVRSNEQGVEPMNKMATEPMTGTAAAEEPKAQAEVEAARRERARCGPS